MRALVILGFILASQGLTAPLAGEAPAYPLQGAPAPDPADVDVAFGLRIPMRDGVNLAATLYRPRKAKGPLPCVFVLMPYTRSTYHARGMYFAANGYAFVAVDVRGRGDSEGVFRPLGQEAQDGHDVVEWLAAKPFCNGKVAMWGFSYGGYDQWATAMEHPAHLATITPVASCFPGLDFPQVVGIKQTYPVRWLSNVAGHALAQRIDDDVPFWSAKFQELYDGHRAFRELDRVCGLPSPVFQEWLQHPMQDAYWDALVPTSAQYRSMDLPILTITGQYDADQQGALEHYSRHLAAAGPEAPHFLIIGPWDHMGTISPKPEFGGLKFGKAALVDTNALLKDWYDWTLKGGTRPAWLQSPVAYYETGAGAWHAAPSLDGITGERRTLFLDSRNGANDPFASGTLGAAKPAGGTDSYVYDPMDTQPGDQDTDPAVPQLLDQQGVLLNHGHSLIYHTAPFERTTHIAGFPRLDAFLSIDQPDTDFEADLYDIAPDGSSLWLGSAYLRARYRHGLRSAEPVAPGRIEPYTFSTFPFVARTLGQGHRLRLVFGPVNDPGFEKNYNSGGAVEAETGKDARTVVVRIYHDREHPSALVIPIASASN